MIYLKDQIAGIGNSFSWSGVIRDVFGAIRVILTAIQPLLHIAIKGFTILLEVVIGVVNGIISMIIAIGKLFGMKEFKQISPTKNAVANSTAEVLSNNNTNKKTSPTSPTSKAGTSTTAVESRGVQNFNISINKLVEQITLKATTIKEGKNEIKDAVAEALLAAVNDFQLLATK